MNQTVLGGNRRIAAVREPYEGCLSATRFSMQTMAILTRS